MNTIHLISDVRPAMGGCLPCRISLHNAEGWMPFATHIEALQEDGTWARSQGNYFSDADLVLAVADFKRRCKQLDVLETGDNASLASLVRECLPDLHHYAETHGAGPDRRLANLRYRLEQS